VVRDPGGQQAAVLHASPYGSDQHLVAEEIGFPKRRYQQQECFRQTKERTAAKCNLCGVRTGNKCSLYYCKVGLNEGSEVVEP